jgi:2-methylaconitate cis-trans-isomerase PrpF
MVAFCEFRLSKNFGIVEIDSDEGEIKRYLKNLASEFRSGNAKLVAVTTQEQQYGGHRDIDGLPDSAATYVQVMASLEDLTEDDLQENEAFITDKAIEVLEGASIQVTHAISEGDVSHIGFSQL